MGLIYWSYSGQRYFTNVEMDEAGSITFHLRETDH
ncbi:hypothetical protein EYZ11_000886 [Aspergillus tanneri]|uniref:Uncharacterized protein n=1 Tax=Aspergillus tanneri TaxID=1220188 RepID=A0A4S3JVY5_9EURO|nr:hypothetical protein EYZ11_000886 [Aspergillus tanneri]